MLLHGTRALVTGATSGLGMAMARALVNAGARVAITSRDDERARHVAAGLGPGTLGLALDVRDEVAVAAGVAERVGAPRGHRPAGQQRGRRHARTSTSSRHLGGRAPVAYGIRLNRADLRIAHTVDHCQEARL